MKMLLQNISKEDYCVVNYYIVPDGMRFLELNNSLGRLDLSYFLYI